MRMKLCLLALAIVALSAPEALACRVPRIKTIEGQTVTGYMFATSGRRCGIKVRNSRGPTLSTSLVSAAKNGTVVVSGGRVGYTSKPGFAGDDSFRYARRGLNKQNEPVVRTINVLVKVEAK
jgi:hypothetical protein